MSDEARLSTNWNDIEQSIRLGIMAEEDCPELGWVVGSLTDKQIKWLASWLYGEGWKR